MWIAMLMLLSLSAAAHGDGAAGALRAGAALGAELTRLVQTQLQPAAASLPPAPPAAAAADLAARLAARLLAARAALPAPAPAACAAPARPEPGLRRLYALPDGRAACAAAARRALGPAPLLLVLLAEGPSAAALAPAFLSALFPHDRVAVRLAGAAGFEMFEDDCGASQTAAAGGPGRREVLARLATSPSAAPGARPLRSDVQALLSDPALPARRLVVHVAENATWDWAAPPGGAAAALVGLAGADVELQREPGGARAVLSPDLAVATLLQLLPRTHLGELTLLPPLWDAAERDYVLPLMRETARGVVGVDLYWSELAEDVLYWRGEPGARALLLDLQGTVLAHSHLPRPGLTSAPLRWVPVEQAERGPLGPALRRAVLGAERGGDRAAGAAYSWQRAAGLLVACVVREAAPAPAPALAPAPAAARDRDLLLHRVDLFPPREGLCRHFRQTAAARPAVFLSPSSFTRPGAHLRAVRGAGAAGYLRDCLAYLRGASPLLASPGLRRGVAADAAALARHVRALPPAPRAVARVHALAADTGVLASRPGAPRAPHDEPAHSAWARRALARPGELALSPPVLDQGGAGAVLTLAYTPPAQPRLVLALELAPAYLLRVLRAAEPRCAAPGARCFLLDARGAVLAHPELPARGALHVTRAESALSLDLLARGGPVRKRACADWAAGAVQRYYEFNVTAAPGGAGAGAGAECARYAVAPVPGAAALLVLAETRCASAFCPCNRQDRLCLNCHRMEQAECECPCECPACGAAAELPACEPPEEPPAPAWDPPGAADALEPCGDDSCAAGEALECASAAGCGWCAAAADGAALAEPYCAAAAACPGGVQAQPRVAPRSPLAPAAAAALGAALLLGAAAYCRRRRPRAACAPPSPSAPGPRALLLPAAGGGGGEPARPSPYRVVTGGRRRRHGSDHGYSTMTPQSDSTSEPAPLSDDTRSEAGSARAAGPGAARGPAGAPAHTVLGRVLAPVTVHRHMEAV